MASKAALKRLDAIQDLVSTFIGEDGVVSSMLTVDNAVALIESLTLMGYTDRWEKGLKAWANLIRSNPDDVRWALQQGAIFAGYAAL